MRAGELLSVLRTQCAQWVAELEEQTPTVVLVAHGPQGEDLVAARVALDGREIAERLDGKAIALDPGPHTLRFTIDGAPPRDETVLVTQGEHERRVVADFRRATSASSSSTTTVRAAPIPLAVPIFGGVALAGFGVFAAAGLVGLSEKNDLDTKQCKPTCPQSEVDAARTKFVIADVGLGVGAASLVVAVIALLTKGDVHVDDHPPAVALTGGPIRGGASVELGGSF